MIEFAFVLLAANPICFLETTEGEVVDLSAWCGDETPSVPGEGVEGENLPQPAQPDISQPNISQPNPPTDATSTPALGTPDVAPETMPFVPSPDDFLDVLLTHRDPAVVRGVQYGGYSQALAEGEQVCASLEAEMTLEEIRAEQGARVIPEQPLSYFDAIREAALINLCPPQSEEAETIEDSSSAGK